MKEKRVTVMDYSAECGHNSDLLRALERGFGVFAAVPLVENVQVTQASSRETKMDGLTERESKAVSAFYRELMEHRYFGEGVLDAGDVTKLLEVGRFDATAQRKLVAAFESLFALSLEIDPVAGGYRFSFGRLT